MLDIELTDRILLTGAGFTKNFGGFLAKEILAHIFNTPAVRASATLKKRLVQSDSFEAVYSEVLNDASSPQDDKDRIKQAVREAYRLLDDAIRFGQPSSSAYSNNVGRLLNLFGGDSSKRGLIFTLNQDLWLERHLGCNCPCVDDFDPPLLNRYHEVVDPSAFRTLHTQSVAERGRKHVRERTGFVYFKLHGSYAWQMPGAPDQMVIGTTKQQMIRENPIFAWYFDVFKWAIAQGGRRLLVVGYGFMDQHINDVLLKGVLEHDLKLYVLNPLPLNELRAQMENGRGDHLPLLDRMVGYYPCQLSEAFPATSWQTIYNRQILADLA